MTGFAAEGLSPFDELMVSFIQEKKAPGAALAVTKDGRLLLARGYGWSDPETEEPIEPESTFRIASLSKPITALAILRLVDHGRLALDDRIGDILDWNSEPALNQISDPRILEITIRQALQHTGGFDRGASFDPMFRSERIARATQTPAPAKPSAIIEYMLQRPLDFAPGERYAYSNFGYLLLGRVIERITDTDYEDWVQRDLLAPLGIQSAALGHTRFEDRREGEVRYHHRGGLVKSVFPDIEERVERPYGGWYLEAMDAHGGWIASAPDLARLVTALDAKDGPLSDEFRTALEAAPAGLAGHDADGNPKPTYYGLGWSVRHLDNGGVNLWHTGSLNGTETLMVRRHDGLCWICLFNTRNGPDGKSLVGAIDAALHRAANAVETWPPDIDGFEPD